MDEQQLRADADARGVDTLVVVIEPLPPHSNVYIRGWPSSWAEDDLRAVAGVFGDIDSVRICSAGSSSAPPHAFVRYVGREAAGACIRALHGVVLDGMAEPLTVKSADSDVLPRVLSGTSPSDWCYVRNLPSHFTPEAVVALFSSFGLVMDVKLFSSNEIKKGTGALVQLESVVHSSAAIQGLNGMSLPGAVQPLIVRYADTPAEKAAKQARRELMAQARVPRGAPANASLASSSALASIHELEAQLRLLGLSAAPTAAVLAAPGITPSLAAPALPTHTLLGGLEVATPKPSGDPAARGAPPPGGAAAAGTPGRSTIVVNGLPDNADRLWMYERFAQFGAIDSVHVQADQATGRCSGAGLVNFRDPTAARAAHDALNGFHTGSRLLHIAIDGPPASSQGLPQQPAGMPHGPPASPAIAAQGGGAGAGAAFAARPAPSPAALAGLLAPPPPPGALPGVVFLPPPGAPGFMPAPHFP
eukprot:scaffold1.g5468.t1